MTLELYDADRLNQMALRVLDISGAIRQMANILRLEPEIELAIHDRKSAEWLANLERWAAESQAKLEMARIKNRGMKKAAEFSASK